MFLDTMKKNLREKESIEIITRPWDAKSSQAKRRLKELHNQLHLVGLHDPQWAGEYRDLHLPVGKEEKTFKQEAAAR